MVRSAPPRFCGGAGFFWKGNKPWPGEKTAGEARAPQAPPCLPGWGSGGPPLDHKGFGSLPEDATADRKGVIALCREDAASDVDRDEIRREADAGLQDTVSALTKYLLGDDLKLEFKPISEYSEEVAADE